MKMPENLPVVESAEQDYGMSIFFVFWNLDSASEKIVKVNVGPVPRTEHDPGKAGPSVSAAAPHCGNETKLQYTGWVE